MYPDYDKSTPPGPSQLESRDQAGNLITAMDKQQGPLLGTALTIPSTVIAQIIGTIGYHFVLIDMEHSPLSPEITTQMVHAIVASSRGATFPIVRVPSHGVEWIKWALDSGASGIIVPMVSSKKEVDRIIDGAIYPPHGSRSFGPARAPWGLPSGPEGGVGEYFQRAKNGEFAIFPMIESREGLANAEDIVSTKGVSGVFVGPMDLRLSLGLSGLDGTEPAFLEAIGEICTLGEKHGKFVGSLAMNPDVVQKRTQDGMKFLVISSDAGTLSAGLTTHLEKATQEGARTKRPSL
ncbi:Pyruvate/Phosphoenolpyruvate kinase-like domain-containing protein [Pestalotiopsis sp. NC0098]|nr:Pyruvate/Phosphoenolpyruvate kinase-like domain-containing protein [Pestalotiopsis sp. NC0098]